MGIIRKATSISTLGLVDYRSDKERIARYGKQTRNATRAQVAQNAMQLELQRQQLAQGHVQHVEAQAQRIAPVGPEAYGLPGPSGQHALPAGPSAVPAPIVGPRAGWFTDEHGWRHFWDGQAWVGRPQRA